MHLPPTSLNYFYEELSHFVQNAPVRLEKQETQLFKVEQAAQLNEVEVFVKKYPLVQAFLKQR